MTKETAIISDTKKNAEIKRKKELHERLTNAAKSEVDELLSVFETSLNGLSEEQTEVSRENYGQNVITRGKKISLVKRLTEAFINPFTAILIALALVTLFTDIILAEADDTDLMAVIIITTMVLVSGILRFVQETRSGQAAENLLKMIKTTINVKRKESGNEEIPLDEVVVGDIVYLAAGDMIPADMRIIQAKDLFISQSALTGESITVEKTASPEASNYGSVLDTPNLAFMGSNVISGSAVGIVLTVGDDTIFGEMAKTVNTKPVQTSFEKGVNSVSWLLIRFMLIMVPIVLFVNGFTKGDWMHATMFALSVAVGLTPEMLPMIVTTCLAKGAVAMSKKKTIIKNLNSIQNLGSMNILCTDKTGTLTQDKVVLMYHLNTQGVEDSRVLRHAFLNSYYQTGLKNLMDIAIIQKTKDEEHDDQHLQGLAERYTKVDEIPFDFVRRRMSVVVQDGKTQMITKGAVEEMLSICSFIEYDGKVEPLTEERRQFILDKVEGLNDDGMRVIAIAQKTNPSP
ncbi:MAG: HAD-IC family P-type ATPase, partial [Candidatus Cloacimonetes bacterium]|nr:HAD-IC family P-type ATPase [Candidatus Cloacimonadota bacterium]